MTNRFDIHAPDHMDCWAMQTDLMRADGPVGRTDANGGYWVVMGHEAACTAAKNWEVFSARRDVTGCDPRARGIGIPPYAFPLILSETDPPRQTKLRLLEIPFFKPSKIRAQIDVIQGHIDTCLSALEGKVEVDLFRDYAMPVVSLTTMALVGIDIAHWQDYTLSMHHGGAGPDFDLGADTDRVHAMLLELVRARRAAPRDDIASALVLGEVMGAELADEEALSMLSALVLGGFDTVASLITSSLIWLDANRSCHADLLADDALMANAVHEFLRMWPPSLGGARNVMGDTVLGGRQMRDGDRIFLSWAATNRDPDVFDNPHTVRLDRANASENLTFGVGPHRCLGLELARLTGKMAIRKVLERYPGFRIRHDGLVRYRSKGFVAGWSAVPASLA